MATTTKSKPSSTRNAANGAVLQMAEAITLGMPLEVWKTRMGRFRSESTLTAFRNVYTTAGGGFDGVRAFWAGSSAKMVECAFKGAILLWSKEALKDGFVGAGLSGTTAGFLAGAGGGVCQVSIMGPCTFLVTAVVTSAQGRGSGAAAAPKPTLSQHFRSTWAAKGIQGFYPGGVAIAFRQATNWASRQGFTDLSRELILKVNHGNDNSPLTVREEFAAGILGGTLSSWNHPFEVARIEAQARAAAGQSKLSMMQIFRMVYGEHGVAGLFKGVVPRIFLGIWQTTFMVTGANLIRTHVLGEPASTKGRH